MKAAIKTFLISLLLISIINRNCNAQDLRFEHIGNEEGISGVSAILQDSKGYIWIGTWDGLNKYDGYSFTKYKFDPFDSTSLPQNFIYTIWEDREGAIWAGTFEGLCKFDRYTEKFTRYKPDPKSGFPDPNISAINEDINGMMWVGSTSGGLCRFDRQTGEFLPGNFDLKFKKVTGDQDGLHDCINCINKDKSGSLWIGNYSGLHELTIQRAKKGSLANVTIKHYLNDPHNSNSINSRIVISVFEDHKGILWIATKNGLNSFDKVKGRFFHYQHDPKNIHSLSTNKLGYWNMGVNIEDKEGNLWIASEKGLNKLNRDRNSFTVYRHNPTDANSLSSDTTTSIIIDRSGILWCGSWFSSLNKADLNQKPFGFRQNEPGNVHSLSNNEVTAILEDSSGVVWIGTNGGGLNRWNKKTNQFTQYRHTPGNPKMLQYNTIYGLMEDHHGHLWVCNGEVLSKFNKETGSFTHYNSNEKNYAHFDERVIYAITQDQEGLIWLGTGNGIKSFNETTGKFKHYYHSKQDASGISDYTATAIFADSRNNIWVGFGSIATDKLDKKTGRISHYKHNPRDPSSISSNIVNSFYEDSHGKLWLATLAGGLCQYDYATNSFTTYTDKQGLVHNTVFSILEDNHHHLWLGTYNGLSKFDPVTKTFTNYDYKDGLQGNIFAAGHRDRPARFKGKDGVLYFGGKNGFNFFHPEQIKATSDNSPVVITQFKLFDQLVKGANESKKIILEHNENYFSFEFSYLSYRNPSKNKYAYKLEGVDKDWVYSGSRRYTSYTNISPGTYLFKVKASNSDGIWNEQGTTVTIIIRPPWWKTWWAYCIYGILLVAGIIAVHRFQKQRVIRNEREKAQKKELEQAKEIEKAYKELKTTQQQLIQSAKMASLGELTAGIAHEIQNPLNFVNNFSEVNRELISELVEEVDNGNTEEVKAIAKDIKDNEEKINHHGKRAESIVSGMLQHSRTSSGIKEQTDINKLADEYLRLAYHSRLKAAVGQGVSDNDFKCNIITDFDDTIGMINIIPQDIGRVILNLINNAFYAVAEKAKQGITGYEPIVTVSTKRENDKPGSNWILISVKDNGNGIPQKIADKIFQPFFTTKPSGQGTGLGLSISYDIVKAHEGEIKVKTKEGEGSEFIIGLPA